jgi:hypothetical protein
MASLRALGLPLKELVVATLGANMATTLCLNFCLLTAKFYVLVVRFIELSLILSRNENVSKKIPLVYAAYCGSNWFILF